MFKHAEKIENFLKEKRTLIKYYNYKLYQMLYQGLYIIIIGSVAYGDQKNCSVPLKIFLKGLFYIYIISFILNFFLFLLRYFKNNSEGSGCYRSIKSLTLRIETCYFPVYWALSILEFCWYVLGAEWITEDNNCMDQYPNGARLTQALVALWIIFLICLFGGFVAINWHLCKGKYSGNQTLGPEIVVNYPIRDIRSHPETPKIVENYTYSNTPARQFDD